MDSSLLDSELSGLDPPLGETPTAEDIGRAEQAAAAAASAASAGKSRLVIF